MYKRIISFCFLCMAVMMTANAEGRYNFNAGWRLKVGKNIEHAQSSQLDDSDWKAVTLPYAFNGTEAFARDIHDHTDTICWYRKTFVLPKEAEGKRVFIEFEGVRQAARVFVNGKSVGLSENGAMAFGFDLTPYIKKGKNLISVRVDNDWKYHESQKTMGDNGKMVRSGFQWNDMNFNANYGGITKNVWLHIKPQVFQTLPLYSNLGTTGVYVYAKDYDIKGHSATIHAESQVVNASGKNVKLGYSVEITDKDGKRIATFSGREQQVAAGDTVMLSASRKVDGLHFWSTGYGYLYTVKTKLLVNGKATDEVSTRTGFRKTQFADGMLRLNDRALHLKGFAQRSSNEWPAIGASMPVWMSDYSNRLALECNGNFFRWMHITPMKQDVESFDRLGLIHAMPAGDAEKDVTGRRWELRKMLMRDAIIYNKNNPSILFYECGNNQISEEHMREMKQIRDQYDPNGGRAIGSRNMQDSREAEYGGEMLYVDKSATKPMFMMEYCRDEGIRRYWDQWSYPYHKEGEGPLFRGNMAVSYNHNQDGLAVENVIRWNEYWMARPGQGRRINAGGAKIIFSDSNTHYRGEKNYRTSGDVDAMRIAKDSYFAHQVMWDGWVDNDHESTYIIGHWNYDRNVVKPVYVVSTGDEVELLLNGKSLGKGERSNTFLFTFSDVKWQAGELTAVSYKKGKEVSRYSVKTAGDAKALRMHWVEAPKVFRADGHDIRIAEIEVVDKDGQRCPLAHDMVTFSLQGNGEWLGGVSGLVEDSTDNRILNKVLPIEAGVCRVMVRSTTEAGELTVTASAADFKAQSLSTTTTAVPVADGFYVDAQGKPIEADWGVELPLYLTRGETPATPSYTEGLRSVEIEGVEVATGSEKAAMMYDDNEKTKWTSDGVLANAWAKFTLKEKASVCQIAIRLDAFRSTSYPLQVYADGQKVWEGYTPKCLGDNYLVIDKPVAARTYEIRMIGPATVKEAFGDMTELAAKKTVSTKASKNNRLGITEIEFDVRR